MSQITLLSPGAVPAVPTSFVTDSGAAVPVANVLNILGGVGAETSAAGNTVTVTVSGMVEGTGTTVGAVTADLITFALPAIASVYKIKADVVGYSPTANAGVGYELVNSVRTTGAAAVLVGAIDRITDEEAALVGCNADIVVAGNTFIVRATGTAGQTIRWNSRISYIFVQ